MTLPMLKQPLLVPPETRGPTPAGKPASLRPVPEANLSDRALMTRPTGSVFARHVRWGTVDDGEIRRRVTQGARPAGLYFSTLDWSGNGGGPTEHQREQSVEQVFGSFNWT